MIILNNFELELVFGGVSQGYSHSPALGKRAKATVECDATPTGKGFYDGCTISCVGSCDVAGDVTSVPMKLNAGNYICNTDQIINCACVRAQDFSRGCTCTFEDIT